MRIRISFNGSTKIYCNPVRLNLPVGKSTIHQPPTKSIKDNLVFDQFYMASHKLEEILSESTPWKIEPHQLTERLQTILRIYLFITIAIYCHPALSKETLFSTHQDSSTRPIFSSSRPSSSELFSAYMSEDLTQRRMAEAYVLGVIDSTEGRSWCGYRIASPSALQEQIFLSLKHAAESTPKQSATKTIESRLRELLPCKTSE